MKSPMRVSLLACAMLLAACGRDEPAAPAEPAEVAETAPAPAEVVPEAAAPEAPAADADAPLVASDLDVYARGMAREIELLRDHADALAKARADKNDTAEIAALMALGSVEVRDAGAAAAGVDVARYVAVKETIDEVLGAVEMGAAMKTSLEAAEQADLSGFTEEQRQQHEAGLAQMRAAWSAPYDRLPADVRDAFKAREAELAKLRADALALRLGALNG